MSNGEEFVKRRVAGAYHKGLTDGIMLVKSIAEKALTKTENVIAAWEEFRREMNYVDGFVSSKYSEDRIEQLKKRFGLL